MNNNMWVSEKGHAPLHLIAAYKVLGNADARMLFEEIENKGISVESFFEQNRDISMSVSKRFLSIIPEIRKKLASVTFEVENLKNEGGTVVDCRNDQFSLDKEFPAICYVRGNWRLLEKNILKCRISCKADDDAVIVFTEKDSESYIRDFAKNRGILILERDFRSAGRWLKIFHSKMVKGELAMVGLPSEPKLEDRSLSRAEEMAQILSKSKSENITNTIERSVFVSGSISIRGLPGLVVKGLDKLVAKKNKVLVGDADGVDLLIQRHLAKLEYRDVTVYSVYDIPRNVASRHFQTVCLSLSSPITKVEQATKDAMMTEQSDVSFVIWDGASSGSYQNILRCLSIGKEVQVYLVPEERYLERAQLNEQYISQMYNNAHRFSLTEYLKINKGAMRSGMKSSNEMKKVLEDRGIIKNDSPSPEYMNLISKTMNRGKPLLKFQKALLDELFVQENEAMPQTEAQFRLF